MKLRVVCAVRLPILYDGISLVSGSSAMKIHWSPYSAGSLWRTLLFFLNRKLQISSLWINLQVRFFILASINTWQRSPARSRRDIIVFRLMLHSRSVERIEHPSKRHCSARTATSMPILMVPKGDWGLGSENVTPQ